MPITIPSKDECRARFHELTAERARIDAKLDPLRAELDAIAAGDTELSIKKAAVREAELREQIKALQAELFPIENERAVCVKIAGPFMGDAA